MRRLFLTATALSLLSTAAFAQEAPAFSQDISKAPAGEYVLEKAHASIVFKVTHMGLSHYTMRFNDFDATVKLDPEHPENSKLDVTIRPGSFDSHDEKLLAHVLTKDFFHVEQYPTITFTSSKIEKTGDHTGKIYGNLTLLGKTNPVVLDTTFNNGGMHPFFKKYALGFSAQTTIKRSDFGMAYGVPMVSDNVETAIEVEMLQK